MSTGSGIKAHWGFSSYTLEGDAAHTLSVNVGNGNLVVSATDKAFPARIPAVLMRTYNSENSAVSGMLGKGWMFSFEEHVEKVNDDYVYTDTTGAEYTWNWNSGTSSFDRPTGVFSDLTVVSGEVIITMPNGFKRIFDETTGLLLRYEDTNGNKLRFTRDENDRLDSIDANYGDPQTDWVVLVEFDYDGNDQCTEFGQSLTSGPKWTLAYTSGNLTTITDPESQVWTYVYTDGVLGEIKDPRYVSGIENATIGYDASTPKRVTSITDVEDNAISFSYSGYETTVTDRRGEDTKMTHADDGTLALIEIELPLPVVLPRVDPYTIDFSWTNLTLTMVTDALGRETDYTYDTNGNVTFITKNDGTGDLTTSLRYNPNNTLKDVTTPAPLNNRTAFTYDNARNLETITLPEDVEATPVVEQTFSYDESGNGDLVSVIDQSGQEQRFTYDPTYGVLKSSSLVKKEASEDIELTTEYTYGTAAQWVIEAKNPSGISQHNAYDDIGRLTEVKTSSDSTLALKTIYSYDECGNVTKIRPPKGAAPNPEVPDYDTHYTYNNLNLLATTILPETATASTYEYGYDEEENLISYKQHLDGGTSFETTYTYDEINRLVKTTLPTVAGASGPSEYEIEYDAVGNVTKTIDALDDETDYTYNYLNQVLTEAGPIADLKFGYTYDTDGRLTEIIGQPEDLPSPYEERIYTYIYNKNGWLTSLRDPLYVEETNEVETKYEYYPNGQLMNVQLPLQNETGTIYNRTYTYYSTGRVNIVKDAGEGVATYIYRSDGKQASQIDAEGNTTSYEYDKVGRNTRINYAVGNDGGLTDPDNAPHAAFVYDENSNITTMTGPDGFRTVYTYDDRDRLITMRRYDDTILSPETFFDIEYSYDQLGRTTTTTSQRGSINTFAYDEHSRLTEKVIDIDQAPDDGFEYTYKFGYDLNGRVTMQTNPDNGEIEYEYDALGRVTTQIDEIDGEVTNTYDLWGNLTKQEWQDGTADTYGYDGLQRLTTQTNPLGQAYEYTYDANGNNLTLVAPWGALTEFSYSVRNELTGVKTTDPSADDPRAQIEIFAYTPNGRLFSYNGPKGEYWEYKYDSMGRWITLKDTNQTVATRTYNGSNTLATSKGLEGGNFSMAYNGYRLRTSTTADDVASPNTTDYTWADLDLLKVEEPGEVPNRVTTDFVRDRLGRIISVTTIDGIDIEATAYSYNWRNQITQRKVNDGTADLIVEDFSYDLRGLLTQVDYTNPTGQIKLEYDARGRQVLLTFPNGVTRFFNYNQAGRMVVDILQDARDYVFMTFYSYDQHGRRVINILDRQFTTATPPPIFTPQNDEGNPVIPTSGKTQESPILNYDVYSYEAETWANGTKDTNYTIYHLTKTGGDEADEMVYAENGSSTRVGVQGNVWRPTGTYLLIDLLEDPYTTPFSTTQLSGQWSIEPTEYAAGNLIKDTTPQYDFANDVSQEGVDETGSSLMTDDYDRGKECCGKLGMSDAGAAVASEKKGRGMVKQEMSFDKGLKGGGSGNMNQIPEPWATLVDDDGGVPQESQLSTGRIETGQEEIRNIIKDMFGHIELTYDGTTGRMDKISKYDDSDPPVETIEAEFTYDNYGRLVQAIDRTQESDVTKNYHNDWKTGNMDLQDDGTTVKSFNHGPGWTRGNQKMTPWEVEEWIHNGPQGSGKWYLDEDGNLQRYNGYSTWGNHIHQEVVSGSPKQPGSIGGDTRPIDSYAQLTVGNSLSTDKTPMIGALDSPPASGAKFGGNSGNPDSFFFPAEPYGPMPGEVWDGTIEFFPPGWDTPPGHNGWSITGPGGISTGPYVPPTDGPFPGTGNPDAPWDGPNDQQDTFTQADKRLAGTWPEQEFYGAKPGKQTGAMRVSDGRDIRQPLPSNSPAGGNGGPIKFGQGGQNVGNGNNGWSIVGPGGISTGPAVLPAGPWPLKPNPWLDTKQGSFWIPEGEEENAENHTQDSGTTDQSALDRARDFIDQAWDNPLGMVAGAVAIGAAFAIGIVAAPLTLAGVAAVMGAALVVGAATNLLFGAIDVANGGMVGNAIDSIGGGAVTTLARGFRNAFITATAIVEIAALSVGFVGATAALGRGGFVKLGSELMDDVAKAAAKRKAKMAAVRATGNAGESPVGKKLNLPRNYKPFGPKDHQRVPDFIKEVNNKWHEVKNRKKLSLIEQLVDTYKIAQGEGQSYHLWVRGSTELSKPLLRELLANDDFFLHYIPGT